MTSLIVWIGVDSRKPSSIYVASDSRVTWGPTIHWDYGRKVFACKESPDILGYCGDILFPSQILGRVVDYIDAGLLFGPDDPVPEKQRAIFAAIRKSFRNYPVDFTAKIFTIVHCTREDAGMNARFHVSTLTWSEPDNWTEQQLELPVRSGVVERFASGAKTVDKWLAHWNNTSEKGTSRSVFGAFCDAINSGNDPNSGGAPQLVSIYGTGAAKTVGIIYKNERFVFGLPVEGSVRLAQIEWRNKLFERCSWETMEPELKAQRHTQPRGLAKA